jgi:hypothetical protein
MPNYIMPNSHCSRIVVIKSIISAMPNYIMCALKVHYTHLDHIEKSTRRGLGANTDSATEIGCQNSCIMYKSE